MKIILIMGLVYLFTLTTFVQGYVAPRDDNHVPASVICDRDGNFVVIIGSAFWTRTSTSSTVQIYYDGKIAKIDTDGRLQVETSTDSRVQIYYGTSSAVVRDGSSDDNLPSEKGLLVQSNLHAFDANKWHRLLVEATNYHNLRVALYENGRILSINDFDSDDQAEGRDGIVVYSNLFGWNTDDDKWDRLRVDEMKNLKVILGSNSVVGIITSILNPVTTYMTLSQFNELNNSIDDIYSQLKSSIPVFYKVINSTYVYRKVYANGNFTVNFNVKAIGCYAKGGNATITWDGGDVIDVWEGIPFFDAPIDEAFDKNVTFTYTLSVPTTMSMYIRGIP